MYQKFLTFWGVLDPFEIVIEMMASYLIPENACVHTHTHTHTHTHKLIEIISWILLKLIHEIQVKTPTTTLQPPLIGITRTAHLGVKKNNAFFKCLFLKNKHLYSLDLNS